MLAALLAAVLVVAPAPSASPSSSPGPSSSPVPSPSPSQRASLPTIAQTTTYGRQANLVGVADAASEGVINQEEVGTRPILRPGEILEEIPGLVISQHSGEGKANQYYLRGFQLDHGTDLAGTIDGMPVNLPTHAHGQGYSDINWLMPELVQTVEYRKGPYYADEGDFSTAGSYDLYYRDTIPATYEIGIGTYGYDRIFLAGTARLGAGNLLSAFELYHDNGSFVKPDEYVKLNGVLRWSRSTQNSELNVMALAYRGVFDSTDQIPQRLVDAGLLNPYGYIDPSDGGLTYRYSLSTEYFHVDPNGVTRFNAYGYKSYLDLFSNFEYYLNDATDYYNVTSNPLTCYTQYSTCAPGPGHVSTYVSYCPANTAPPGAGGVPSAFTFACGDQREQLDDRFVSGFNASRSFVTSRVRTTVGAGLRNDNISTVGLYLTQDRIRFPMGTLSDDHVVERDVNAWVQSETRVGAKLRLTGGLRNDIYDFVVDAPQPANSGKTAEGMMSPKFLAAYAMSADNELYADFGDSFHSNDARGIFQTLDPQTNAPYDATGAPVLQVTPLVRAAGEEVGYRFSDASYTATLSLWQLNLNSELVFDGDHGTTYAGGPTVRKGFELTNYWKPSPALTYDLDFADSSARFLTNFNGQGTSVPESLNAVASAGATLDKTFYSAALRLRYFGPRVLDQEGDAFSTPSLIFNAQYTAKLRSGCFVRLSILNLLNAHADDVEYYYASWLPYDAANPALARNAAINPALGGSGVNDYHFHPAQKLTVRLALARQI